MTLKKRVCIHCGEEFYSERSSAKYCQAKCKMAVNRKKWAIDEYEAEIKRMFREMALTAKKHPEFTERIDQMLETVNAMALEVMHTRFWKCEECGQKYFGQTPPRSGFCDYCRIRTRWVIVEYTKNEIGL